ncbi:MAG TPA: 2'-5' RNA ligase family protein [Acidimicrobiales bacterium]|nr:2'-5' RNA ligase family protein [Acidimicrobiales bacterium]
MTNFDRSDWEAWQDEYRNGAFYLFPPSDVATVVNDLRSHYDPKAAAICDAHISLSEPLDNPLSEEQLDELRSALAGVSPFELAYGPLTSIGSYPGVVFAVAPVDDFFALRTVVQSTTIFADRALPRAERVPHMTVAEFISIEETHDLLARLRDTVAGGSFVCDHVVYAVPDASFHFEPVFEIPLGSTQVRNSSGLTRS